MIGALGDKNLENAVVFEILETKVLTFKELVRSNGVRFQKHDVLLQKPKLQYVGEELDKISFIIQFSYQLGTDPLKETDKLVILQRDGTALSFFLGDKGFGRNKWVIESLNINYPSIDNKGRILSATCEITLLEYI